MKKAEISVGRLYQAKVSGKLVTVRVDAIREVGGRRTDPTFTSPGRVYPSTTVYDVTDLSTGRKTTFRSAAKFRREAKQVKLRRIDNQLADLGSIIDAKAEQDFADQDDEGDRPFADGSPAVPTPTAPTASVVVSSHQSSEPVAALGMAEAMGVIPARSVERTSTTAVTATTRSQDSRKAVPATSGLAAVLAGKRMAEIKQTAVALAPHVIVQARAGTGKTTTLIEGLKVVKGIGSSLTPSPQQQAVWDQMALSNDAKSVCFVAFNKAIATELQRRVPQGCDAMTMHSLGFKAVQKALGRMEPTQYVVSDIIADLLGMDSRAVRKNEKLFIIAKATEDLVSLCKMNLCCNGIGGDRSVEGLDDSWTKDREELDRLASHYQVELNGSRDRVFELVPKVLDRCKQPKGKINFDDMIWLPVVLNLPLFQYDLLLVDEAQDLNRCQQALAKRSGKRLILVGDDRQAIYGFAGADAESLPRMFTELQATERGCAQVPLTVTRRCGRAIVEEARKIVPDFEAHESCPDGAISQAVYGTKGQQNTYTDRVQDGDFLLCRVNAPLVSQCFRFIRMGRKATIQGRDVGQGLISTVKKLSKDGELTVVEFVAKLSDWLHQETEKEQAKRNPSDAKIIALQDRHDCLLCFTEGATTIAEVTHKIETIFTDRKDEPGIRLSSIHRAKGLESRRVFLLEPEGATVPHPMARSQWQRGQEMNLRYVAITRAIEELVYVS